jgi:MYXO-CTERM domain-containing protein
MRTATFTIVVGFSVLAGSLGLSSPAEACSPPPQYEDYVTHLDPNDGEPPTLRGASIVFKRAEDPSGHNADCSNNGRFFLDVDASDDHTGEDDLGFSLSLVDGRLPFELPDRFVRSSIDSGGDLTSWFTDDGNEFTATIEVRMVDRAGKLSEPVNVRATEDAVGCGCSTAGAGRPGAAAWAGALVVLLFLRRRRSRRGPGR